MALVLTVRVRLFCPCIFRTSFLPPPPPPPPVEWLRTAAVLMSQAVKHVCVCAAVCVCVCVCVCVRQCVGVCVCVAGDHGGCRRLPHGSVQQASRVLGLFAMCSGHAWPLLVGRQLQLGGNNVYSHLLISPIITRLAFAQRSSTRCGPTARPRVCRHHSRLCGLNHDRPINSLSAALHSMAFDKRPQRRATTGALRHLPTTTKPQSRFQSPRRPRGVAGAGNSKR